MKRDKEICYVKTRQGVREVLGDIAVEIVGYKPNHKPYLWVGGEKMLASCEGKELRRWLIRATEAVTGMKVRLLKRKVK